MDAAVNQDLRAKQGAEDSGRYFQYMAQFVDFNEADAETIKQTRPIVEKHLPELVTKFYSHLLRHPPTRKFFLKKDGSIDQPYVELRMRHLTNFWLRTATGVYDDDYARYIDYVGRAHTSHGADPHIYIAERYVIGQVGFVQHAITDALSRELRHTDEEFEVRAVEAWDKLMMVLLEMLSRAYGNEREAESFDALVPVDQNPLFPIPAPSNLALKRDENPSAPALKAANVVNKGVKRARIMLSGSIDRAVTVKGIKLTKGARAAIEAALGNDVLLFGNFDPYMTLCVAEAEKVEGIIKACIDQGADAVWPGCDIWPDARDANLRAYVDAILKYGDSSSPAVGRC